MDNRTRLTNYWKNAQGIERPMFQLRYETYDKDITPEIAIKNNALDLQDQLRRNKEMLAYEHDFVSKLFPYYGTTAFASAFGAEISYINGADPVCNTVVHNAKEAARLVLPHVNGGDLQKTLDKVEYFLEQTKGEYPVSVSDMQGPFDTACLLWEKENFLMSLIDEQEAVHHVMNLVTENFIEFGQKLKNMIPDFVPMHVPSVWAPADYGISLSEDSIVMISKRMFKNLVQPYLQRISTAFGGLTLHSCGNWQQHLASVKEITGLKAINFGVGEMKMEDVAAVFDSEDNAVKITMHTGLNMPRVYSGNIQMIEHGLETFKHHDRLFFCCWANNYNPYQPWEVASYEEMVKYIYSKGFTW
ncbi:MAG: uroporphyrinogen decarboxylase family protein [Clostridia bacterium]